MKKDLLSIGKTIDRQVWHHRSDIDDYNSMRRETPKPKLELFQTTLEAAYGHIEYAVKYAVRKLKELAQTLQAASTAA